MTKKSILGLPPWRFVFALASMPLLIACGVLTKQPWHEMLLSMYSVVTLMYLAQGRRAGPAFGMFYCLGYGVLFFSKQIYGLAAFNALFCCPVFAASLIAWGKHMNEKAVEPKRLTPRGWALSLGASAVGFAGIYLLLRALGSQGALWDSLSLSLVAPGMVMLLLRYAENWIFNLAGNTVVLILWVLNTIEDVSSLSFVLIAALQVATNAIGFVTWIKLEREGRDA